MPGVAGAAGRWLGGRVCGIEEIVPGRSAETENVLTWTCWGDEQQTDRWAGADLQGDRGTQKSRVEQRQPEQLGRRRASTVGDASRQSRLPRVGRRRPATAFVLYLCVHPCLPALSLLCLRRCRLCLFKNLYVSPV